MAEPKTSKPSTQAPVTEAPKAYKDPRGLKTKQDRKEFSLLAGARILQGVGVVSAINTMAPNIESVPMIMSAITCIVVFVLGSYFEHLYNDANMDAWFQSNI